MSGKVPGQDLPAQINIPSETDALPVTAHGHSQTATNESFEKSAEPSKSNLTDDVPMPNLSAQIVFPSGSIVTAEGHPHVNEPPVQSESGDSTCDQIPESPCSQTNVALGTSPTVPVPLRGPLAKRVLSTQSELFLPRQSDGEMDSTLHEHLGPLSPLLPIQGDFIHQIVTGDIKSSTAPSTCNVKEYSVTESISSSAAILNTAPTYTIPQPILNTDILNALPGGANLRQISQGLGALPFTSFQPNVLPQLTNEWQREVSATLSTLVFNQQVIINELKAIKQNLTGTLTAGTTNNFSQFSESRGDEPFSISVITDQLSALQNPIKINSTKDLTMEELDELKKKELKANHSQAHLAMAIMNAITTKEQRKGKSVMGTKTRPTLGSNILIKIRQYYFSVYPCGEQDDEEAIWKQCIQCMDNRLKKYNKAQLK